MQIKTTTRYCFMPIRMARIKKDIITSVGKNMEELKPSYTAGLCKMVQSLWKRVWQFFKWLNI